MRVIIALGTYTLLIIAMLFYWHDSVNTDRHNYYCKKGKLFKSATPKSFVFLKTKEECVDSRDEEKFESSVKADK